MKDAYDLAHDVHLASTLEAKARMYWYMSFDFSAAQISHFVQEIWANTNKEDLPGPDNKLEVEEVCQMP